MAAQEPEKGYEKADAYGMEKAAPTANGALKFGACHVVIGITAIGVCFPLLLDLDNYNNMRAPLDETNSEFSDELSLPPFFLISGILYFFAGILSIYAYYQDKRNYVFGAMGMAVVGSALGLFISIKIKTTKDLLFDKLQGNPVTDNDFGDGPLSIMDYTSAIFNECCFSEYDSLNYTAGGHVGPLQDNGEDLDLNQRAVPECGATLADTCPDEMFPDVIRSVLSILGDGELTELICHCFGNRNRYEKFIQIFRRDDTCNSFRKVRIPKADERKIPVVDISLGGAIGGLRLTNPEISDELPMGEVALVGKILPPQSVYGELAENIGFSCGLGYAKSVALYLYFYLEDKTDPITYGAFACVAASFGAILLLNAIWYCGGNNSDVEEEDEYGDDYRIPVAEVAKKKSTPAVQKSKPKGKKKPGKDAYDAYDLPGEVSASPKRTTVASKTDDDVEEMKLNQGGIQTLQLVPKRPNSKAKVVDDDESLPDI